MRSQEIDEEREGMGLLASYTLQRGKTNINFEVGSIALSAPTTETMILVDFHSSKTTARATGRQGYG